MSVSPFWVGCAHAALGGDAASVLADRVDMHGSVQDEIRQQYAVQEISAATGVIVREYMSRDGIVFAVCWSGPVQPDLRRLLGTYFTAYTAALTALSHPGIQRSVRLTSSGLVVELGGHLRAYTGRAYLVALVPAGVSAADLR
jgi:hypothetical protein